VFALLYLYELRALIDTVGEKVSHTQIPFHPLKDGLNPFAKEIITAALQHDVLFHAVLCISSGCLSRFYLRDHFPEQATKHKGEAIRLLLEGFRSLDSGINDAAIAAATLLSIFDVRAILNLTRSTVN
jgi:hypothetical protein